MKTLAIVDYDSIMNNLRIQGLQPDTSGLVSELRRSIRFLDPNAQLIAFGQWYDHPEAHTDGQMLLTARAVFTNQEFDTLGGDTREDSLQGITKLLVDVISKRGEWEQVVLVSDERNLGIHLEAAMHQQVTVRVCGTSRAPNELRHSRFNFVNIQEQLDLKIKMGVLLLDWENVYIGIKKKGYDVDVNSVIEIVSSYAAKQGDIAEKIAYADFGALAKVNGQDAYDMQRLLEMNGISTRYVVSTAGKSSTDFRIVDDLTSMSNRPNPPDFVVLVSSDRDFTTAIQNLQRRRCKVILLGIQGAMSMAMSKMRGVTVEFLDDLLPEELRRETVPISTVTAKLSPDVRLVVATHEQMVRHNWRWISANNLRQTLVELGGFNTSTNEAQQVIRDAQAEGILTPSRETLGGETLEAFSLNLGNAVVGTARTIAEVIKSRIAYTHTNKGYPTIREGFILRGLEMDNRLQEQGIKLSPATGRAWLELLTTCGVLNAEDVADENRPGMMVRMYRLNDEGGQITLLGTGDVNTMIRRLVTAADHYMAFKGLDWVPLMTLDKQLAPYGRPAYFEATTQLTESGAATISKHENQRAGGREVTGITLNPIAENIQQVRAERSEILYRIWQLHMDGHEITVNSVMTSAGENDGPDEGDCRLWLDILKTESVLVRMPGTKAAYRLDTTHRLVKIEKMDALDLVKIKGPVRPISTQAA